MLGEMESIPQDLAAKGGAMQAPLSKLQASCFVYQGSF